jgi:hypothetical protein
MTIKKYHVALVHKFEAGLVCLWEAPGFLHHVQGRGIERSGI